MQAIDETNRPKDKLIRIYPDLTPDMHAKLMARAKRNFRTIRAEIAHIINEAIKQEERQERQTWTPVLESKG